MFLAIPLAIYFIILKMKRRHLLEILYFLLDAEDYLHNSGYSLKLKRKLITKLEKGLYPYKTHFLLDINERKNKLCSRVFYEKFSNDFEKSLLSVNE